MTYKKLVLMSVNKVVFILHANNISEYSEESTVLCVNITHRISQNITRLITALLTEAKAFYYTVF